LKSALKKSKYKEELPSSEPVVQGSQKVSHLSAVASKKTNQVHVNSTILPAASSKTKDRQEELCTARNELAKTIPASLLSGKVISTKYGLAMLLVPSPNITTTEYNSAMTTHPSLVQQSKSKLTTRFKHWIQSEDELLTYAISKHSPPYSWQDIAHAYFPGTRTANQVRTRLYMRG
jgi:Myb-like DNA-binding domain